MTTIFLFCTASIQYFAVIQLNQISHFFVLPLELTKMRSMIISLLFFISIFASLEAINTNTPVTCFKCIANNTDCHETCTGMYCYKSELIYEGQEQKYIKRGCLARKDELSKVDQCTERPSHLPGGKAVKESFCICQADRCNGASSWWSNMAAFFAAAFAYFWKD